MKGFSHIPPKNGFQAYLEGLYIKIRGTGDPRSGYLDNPTLNAHDRANLTAPQPDGYPGYNPTKEILDHVDDEIVY